MNAEQDWEDALLVACAVTGCERAAGRYCVNITDGWNLRDLPHWSRVLAGRVVRGNQAVTALLLGGGESTSARLRRVSEDRDAVHEGLAAARREYSAAIQRAERAEAERDELRAAFDNLPCGDCWGLGVIPAEAFGRDPDGAPERDEEAPCPEGCEIPAWLRAERNDAADLRRERDAALGKRDRMVENGEYWNRERQLARAELASARTELDRLRHSYSGWIVARDGGRDCLDCDREIRRGEAYELVPTTDELRHVHCPDTTEGAPTA